MSITADRHISFRVRQDDLDRIDQLAAQHELSRTQYVLSVATGQMPEQRSNAMQRIEAIEQRLDLLEERADAAAW